MKTEAGEAGDRGVGCVMTMNRAFGIALLLLSLVLLGCAASSDNPPDSRHGFYGGVSVGGSHT
jgi:hypothetical protein